MNEPETITFKSARTLIAMDAHDLLVQAEILPTQEARRLVLYALEIVGQECFTLGVEAAAKLRARGKA